MIKNILSSVCLIILFYSLPTYANVKYHCQIELFPNNEDMFTGGVYRNDSVTFEAGEKMQTQAIELTYYTFIQPKAPSKKLILKKQNRKLADVKIHYGNRKSDGLLIIVRKDSVPFLIESATDYNTSSVKLQAGTYPAKEGNLLGYTKLKCAKAELWKDEEDIEKI